MSVIVSNMEMPESCAECPLLNTHTYVCTVKVNAGVLPHARAADCPLVSVDTPRGEWEDYSVDFYRCPECGYLLNKDCPHCGSKVILPNR